MRLALDRKPYIRLVLAALAALAFLVQMSPAISTAGGTAVSLDNGIFSRSHLETTTRIIVQEWRAASSQAERSIERLGGRVNQQLPIIGGFSATVPASSVDRLADVKGVRVVTLDRKVTVQGSGGSGTRSVYTKVTRSDDMLKAGYTGKGVTVALVDTGIHEHVDLAGRVLPVRDDVKGTTSPCVNLSGESTCADSYGHGTFLAGIIAGNGASSAGAHRGMAPQANLVSIKIAGRDGSSDVSTVLAAIQWVVSFKDSYGIKVLNLSLGTNGTQSFRYDPLNFAVEKAWNSGIVVVVAASNRGPDPSTISKPGDDPWVITVGATDDRGTAGLGDDRVPNFSSRGPTPADGIAKPDLAAPGAHMVSLRAPGSEIDARFPTYIDGAYRKGSGTSMSTAVVSGAAALALQARPSMSPDALKFAMAATARDAASSDPMQVGAGVVDSYAAAVQAPAGLANQGLQRSSGMGSLDASRGDVLVQANDPLSTVVSANLTLQLLAWDPLAYTAADWSGSTWYGSTWYGSTWYGSTWYGQPEGSTWYGSTWYGSTWYGAWQ